MPLVYFLYNLLAVFLNLIIFPFLRFLLGHQISFYLTQIQHLFCQMESRGHLNVLVYEILLCIISLTLDNILYFEAKLLQSLFRELVLPIPPSVFLLNYIWHVKLYQILIICVKIGLLFLYKRIQISWSYHIIWTMLGKTSIACKVIWRDIIRTIILREAHTVLKTAKRGRHPCVPM